MSGTLVEDIRDNVEQMQSNPETFRRRRLEMKDKLAASLNDPPKSKDLDLQLNLDETLAPAFEQISIFFYSTLGEEDEAALVKYLFVKGIVAELSTMSAVRNRIMEMGNLKEIAEDGEVGLTEDESEIAELTPPSIEDLIPDNLDPRRFWSLGYITTRCPDCRGDAFWHPENHDLICIAEKERKGPFEERPLPADEPSE